MSEINDFLDGRQSSEIDGFLGPDTPKPSGAIRRIADQGIKLAQGVVGVPEAAVGVADLVTGGRAGKLAESAGVRFKDAKQIMGEYLSPEQKAADQEVAQADGFLPTVGAMVRNPSTIAGSVMESAPSMIGGGAAARGLLKVAPKLGAIAAGAAGEGLVSAGQNAEQVRQESPTGLLTPEQSAVLAASGALTGGISLASGKLANKLGIGDVQTMLASGKAGVVGEEAAKAAAGKGVVRKLAEGMANEGVLQELPQSYQEQVAQNIAQGKPWDEGAAKAGAQGMLAGAVMGGGANVVSHVGETAPVPEAAPEPAAPALQIGNTPDPYLSFPDGTVARRSEIDAYINGLPADQQPAARAKAMGLAPQPGTPEPVVKPSEAMGLDPAAGPLSAAAVTAVDTGAHQEIQLQQASEADQAAYEQATAEQEQKVSAPKPTPAAHEYSPYSDANGDIVGMDQQPFRTFREALIQRQFENKAAGRNDFEAIKTGENQFVVRRVRYPEKQSNGPSTEVQPGDTGSTGVRSTDSPASVGVGATDGNGVGAQPRRSPDAVLDQAGQLPKRADAAPVATTRAQPTTLGTQTTATAGPGFTAKDVTRVQNAAPGTNTTPAAPAVEAPAVVAGDAATSEGLPTAGTGAVEGGGIARPEVPALAQNSVPDKSRTNSGQIQEPEQAYDASLGKFRAASKAFGAITKAYRAKEIDDAAYLAGKEAFKLAQDEADVSEREFIAAKNRSPSPTKPKPTAKDDIEHLFGVPEKRVTALDRIAKGFGNAIKAQQFVAQNGLKDTHEVIKTSATRWDVKAKVPQPQEQASAKAPEAVEAAAKQQAPGPVPDTAQPAASDGVAAATEAGQPAEPVAPKSLREVVDRKRAEKAKPAEPPAEQPAPAQASSSRPGEPTAEQIESVGDVVRITKSAGKEIKRTVNASTAMKTLNERAEALQMLAEKCK